MFHFFVVPQRRLCCALTGLRAGLLVACALAFFALPAQAQATRADPLNHEASVPAVLYVSPFKATARPVDDKLLSWRQSNETVARIGGWRSYAREAQLPAVPNAPPVALPAAPHEMRHPMHHGHGGHGRHGGDKP